MPQLERALEQRGALAVGLDVHRDDARAHGGLEGRRLVAGREVVVSDGGRLLGAGAAAGHRRAQGASRGRGRLPGARLAAGHRRVQGARERAVQLGALTGKQVVVHRLAQQRVTQRVAVAVEDHDVARDRLAQPVAQGGPLEPGHLGEHRVVERAAGRQHADHLLRGLPEPLDPQRQRGGEARRQCAATVEPGREQLLREQRVSLAARVEALDQGVVGRCAEDVAELLGQLVAAQAGEVDPQRPRALELGQQRAQGMAAMQLVGPVGREHQQRRGGERGGEEAQERAGRGVRPVQVLDHEQERRRRARSRRAPRAAPRTRAPGRPSPGPARARLAEAGQERGQLRADRRRQRGRAPGRRRARAGAAPSTSGAYASSPSPSSTQSPLRTRTPFAVARAPQLGDQPALADAGLARPRTPARAARRPRRRAPPPAAPARASDRPVASR